MNAKVLRNRLLRLVSRGLLAASLATTTSATAPATRDGAAPGIKPLQADGIENFFAVSTQVYSGSAPEGDAAFAALEKLGIKTIVSVDGTKPDLEAAHKHGMRYVHLPHGYDGISTNLQIQLIKAAETLSGPIYVHCHHGKHRGPTAAAVICMATEGWTPAQAWAWLVIAGTATNYAGLYAVVREFRAPTAGDLQSAPSSFPEVAPVPGLVAAMVAIDDRWDHLKAIRAAGYRTPKEQPDLEPANEAMILWEHYREAQRLPDASHRGTAFVDRIKTGETEAREAEQLLRRFAEEPTPETRQRLDTVFDEMAKSCASCHKAYRDPAGIKAGVPR